MSMFCYQCEQTAHCTGCTTLGICGKSPDCAALQDVMVHIAKGISQYAHRANGLGLRKESIDAKVFEALFMTLTNVNFDENEHVSYIQGMTQTLEEARKLYYDGCFQQGKTPELLEGPAEWIGLTSKTELLEFANQVSIPERQKTVDADIASLQEMLMYGIKGLAAYAHHAYLLGYSQEPIFAFVHEALNYLCQEEQDLNTLLSYNLKAGEVNFKVMELLDKAHTESFGHPVPTPVRITPVKGKAILVSGHDLKSLVELLKQTEGKGINVYTHGEMLPAHGYPGLKKFPHLVGNFGGAWQNQQTEFAEFPGAILLTTNCLKPPKDEYVGRLFTMDVVGWENVPKIENYNYTPLIEAALACPGFTEDAEEKTILVGFGHNAVLNVAGTVIDAVKAGQIKHFFLIGGCDGAEYNRNYFTEFAEEAPQDTVILTLGCGKYRFNKEEFGTVAGIPRLLDVGQCNDAYSAVKIASALADAFGCTVNDLPLSLVISWFEQKAVAVLLTLLHLGIKNIRLGPNLPAFVTPNVLSLLVKTYDLKPVGASAKADLKAILEPALV
ncbi:MAG: hydroxylamine reductase [Vampirovibrionales bacterium]